MKLGEEQRAALADGSGCDTATCAPSHCVAIKLKKGSPEPSCTMDMTVALSLFWNRDAEREAGDRCNSYAVQGARVLPWNKAAEQMLEYPITPEEYAAAKVTGFLFAGPPAAATFRLSGQLASGRLKLTEANIKHKGPPARQSRFDFEILFEVEIVESPVFFLIKIMHENQSHPAVADMRAWPPGQRADVMTTLGFPAERRSSWGWAWAPLTDGAYLENMSEFDLKPRFAPHWGEWNRIENNERVYFYDVWSNLHYGFIGNASGFTAAELNNLAGSDPRGDSAADQRATETGWQLYQRLPEAVRSGSLAAKQQALHPRILEAVRTEDLYLAQAFYTQCRQAR